MIVWKKNCLNLECFLTHETYFDIDGLDLFLELKVLKEVLQINENSPINVLNYIKRLESFPNACIAFRILLTIPVIVASAERSFSKLKLIKSYLRSTMSQESSVKTFLLWFTNNWPKAGTKLELWVKGVAILLTMYGGFNLWLYYLAVEIFFFPCVGKNNFFFFKEFFKE